MSIFGSIMSAIFHGPQAGSQAVQPPSSSGSSGGSAAAQSGSAGGGPTGGTQTASAGAQGGSAGGAKQSVDVGAILTQRASQKGEKLDWRHSIVDLMKVLDLDSSLSARKELAQELHYTGDASDSAAMNTWLHKQVMQKLAENGGNVPQDLRH